LFKALYRTTIHEKWRRRKRGRCFLAQLIERHALSLLNAVISQVGKDCPRYSGSRKQHPARDLLSTPTKRSRSGTLRDATVLSLLLKIYGYRMFYDDDSPPDISSSFSIERARFSTVLLSLS
jgi:hypothetical protein